MGSTKKTIEEIQTSDKNDWACQVYQNQTIFFLVETVRLRKVWTREKLNCGKTKSYYEQLVFIQATMNLNGVESGKISQTTSFVLCSLVI